MLWHHNYDDNHYCTYADKSSRETNFVTDKYNPFNKLLMSNVFG